MAPHYWATEDQLVFLKSHLEGYIKAQKDKTVPNFRNEVTYLWFQTWPEVKPDTGNASDDDEEHGRAIKKRRAVCHNISLMIDL